MSDGDSARTVLYGQCVTAASYAAVSVTPANAESSFLKWKVTVNGEDCGFVASSDVTSYPIVGETLFEAMWASGYTVQYLHGLHGTFEDVAATAEPGAALHSGYV